MISTDFYNELTDQGFNFWLDDGALKYRAPKGKMTADILTWLKTHKLELVSLLATNDHYEKIVVSEVRPILDVPVAHTKSAVESADPQTVDRLPTFSIDRYAHLITCQQCEHLTYTGYCRVKQQVKPLPDAMHDCVSFETVSGERVVVTNAPYTKSEVHDLLSKYEKKLFHHLVDCRSCSFTDNRYCVDAFAIGNAYETMLMVFDDSPSRRESLLNAVVKARVTGRNLFVPSSEENLSIENSQKV